MRQSFQEICQKKLDISSNDHVLVAFSGGVDSRVLLDLLMSLNDECRPRLTIAHVHHHLRKESDEEAAFVVDLCQRLQLPLRVAHFQAEKESGIEEAARRFRYEFFEQSMIQEQATILMTGHHQSDQAETILMRLVRGGDWQRLGGIRWQRSFSTGRLIRPLLAFSKEDLYQYAEEEDLQFVEDSSNQEADYTRNRYRHRIIPLLKEENPDFEQQTQLLAEEIQDLDQVLSDYLTSLLQELSQDSSKTINRTALLALSEPMQRVFLKHWIKSELTDTLIELSPHYFRVIQDWIREGRPNSQYDLGQSYCLVRRYDLLSIQKEADGLEIPFQSHELNVNEWTELNEGERIGLFEAPSQIEFYQADSIYLDAKQTKLPLKVMHRQDGDRMTLKGMDGSRKIKDVFIDQKIPLEKRDQAWLLKDADGRILWLIGYKYSNDVEVVDENKKQYQIIYQRKE